MKNERTSTLCKYFITSIIASCATNMDLFELSLKGNANFVKLFKSQSKFHPPTQ